ncbi:MAG: SDR family oxidoreductase [Pseudomonadota bacterium]
MMFENKVAIVTGGGTGIGAATARRFVEEGGHVALIGRRAAKLEAVAADMADERCLILPADVADEAAIAAAVAQTVAHFGRLDALVNNAGVARSGSVLDTDTETWRMIQSVNVDGIFFASKAALPALIETGGSIVNVASVSGMGADWGLAAYNASKGAVINLSRAMALDHAADGVRVNVIAPSLTETDMTAGITARDDVMERVRNRLAMGRAATPEEIADPILFLLSHAARFVTGAVLPVDGGVTASNGQPRLR